MERLAFPSLAGCLLICRICSPCPRNCHERGTKPKEGVPGTWSLGVYVSIEHVPTFSWRFLKAEGLLEEPTPPAA